MTRECCFTLPTGRKCRAAACRNQAFCRHHAPQPADPPSIPPCDRFSSLARWRTLGRNLQWLDPDDIPLAIYDILDCLILRDPSESRSDISDLAAGRYLRALLNRLGSVPFPHPGDAPPIAPPQHSRSAPIGPPNPSQKLDRQAADALIAAFAAAGLVPPDLLATMGSSHS